ncbi:hypothetical protein [Tenacibaculum maritimum]
MADRYWNFAGKQLKLKWSFFSSSLEAKASQQALVNLKLGNVSFAL